MRFPLLAAMAAASFVLAALLGLFFLLHGAGTVSPLDCLPGETRFFVSVPDPRALLRAIHGTRLRSTGSGQGQDLQVAAAGLLTRALESRGIEFAVSADELAPVLDAWIVVAGIPAGAEDAHARVLIARPSSSPARVVETLLQLARVRIPGFADSWIVSRRHRGTTYHTLRRPGSQGPLCIAPFKNLVLFSTGGAAMRRMIDTAAGRERPVGSAPTCRAVLDRVAPGSDLVAYGSGEWVRGLLPAPDVTGARSMAAELLGLGAARGAGLGIRIVKDLFHERVFISRPAGGAALAGALTDWSGRGSPVRRADWDRFPFLATLSTTDLRWTADRLPSLIHGATGEAPERVKRRLEGFSDFLSIDLAREISTAFEGEVSVGFSPAPLRPHGPDESGPARARALGSIAIRDRGAVERLLRRVDGLARAMEAHRTVRVRGETVTFYESPSFGPIRPAHRVAAGRLWASTSPDLLVEPIEAATQEGESRSRADLDRVLDLIPREAHLLIRADTRSLLEWIPSAPASPDPLLRAPGEAAGSGGLAPTVLSARLAAGGLRLEGAGPLSLALLALQALHGSGFNPEAADAAAPPGDRPAIREPIEIPD